MLNIIDERQKMEETKIKEEMKTTLETIKDSELEIVKQLQEIEREASEKAKALYMSQFSKEDLEKFNKGETVDTSKMILKRSGEITVTASLLANYVPSAVYEATEKEYNNNLEDTRKKYGMIRNHVSCTDTFEQKETLLVSYGFIDKKTKTIKF